MDDSDQGNLKTFESICQPFAAGGELFDFFSDAHKIGFNSKVKNSAPPSAAFPLMRFRSSERIEKKFVHAMNTPGYLDSGFIKLKDYFFIGDCALPFASDSSEILIGEALCWGRDFAKWYTGQPEFVGWMKGLETRNIFDVILKRSRFKHINDDSYIISSPGQEIYGHWILDILPRLYVLSRFGVDSIPKYFNNIPDWASPFLNAFGYAKPSFLKHPSPAFRMECAIMPTGGKSGFRLGREILLASWECVAGSVPEFAQRRQKIFLSRSLVPDVNGRSLLNRSEVESRARFRGYEVVHPQTLSVQDQINLMRHASVVIGEDGSALHNIVFADKVCRLGVLNPSERDNLWHLSICQILGNKIAYCDIPGDKNTPLSLTLFDEFLDCLEGL